MPWTAIAAGSVIAATAGAAAQYQRRRNHYRRLAVTRRSALAVGPPFELARNVDLVTATAAFARDGIGLGEGTLNGPDLATMKAECLGNRGRAVKSYVPTHKKGATLSYEAIHRHAPSCLALYHSPALRQAVSRIVGVSVVPVADHDQSACSILYYLDDGDHIEWHFDHNFYNGRHFTVLLGIEDRGAGGGSSAGRLEWKDAAGAEQDAALAPNGLAVFEGKRVLHRATPIASGDSRIVFSMTFATAPTLRWHREVLRRCKDVAFFGLPAHWK
ncbi:MAG TPA: hypothetical protein VNC50_02675 [Planctomycetia bacterium]|nr:hypothetical protein [Planctomycetia bacterium]